MLIHMQTLKNSYFKQKFSVSSNYIYLLITLSVRRFLSTCFRLCKIRNTFFLLDKPYFNSSITMKQKFRIIKNRNWSKMINMPSVFYQNTFCLYFLAILFSTVCLKVENFSCPSSPGLWVYVACSCLDVDYRGGIKNL